MGKTQSKSSDNNGEIVNNVIIDDTVKIENNQIITLLLIIAVIKLLEFLYCIYKDHKRRLKNKYSNTVLKV